MRISDWSSDVCSSDLAGADYADVNPGVPRNYTWHVLKQSAFFNPGGTFDRDLAEYAMTLIGTVIYVPPRDDEPGKFVPFRSEEHTSELQSLMRISYAVFCLQKKKQIKQPT